MPLTPTTWNPADLISVTLSGANLVATGTAAAVGVRGIASLNSGKYYWECTYTTLNSNSITVGIALATASLTSPGTGTAYVARTTGGIFVNASNSGSVLGLIPAAAVIGIAVDFTGQLIWMRLAPSGNWNGSGTASPATGTGGISISSVSTGPLFPLMSGANADVVTGNFGATAFSGALPSGFNSGFGSIVVAAPSSPGPSDPQWEVATPTGVLQGCAAFSYSGGTWSPPGAGPSVATPTGVLKGIAPFSYSGGWTPTGLSVPDVATPTGVLEGVAVYTWGGSSWAPPSGSSTPTGALRGVAGFQWDGSAWQPAGQAGPSVPTPFGVLDGVALFNWSGSAWVAASAGPPGVTLDLNFITMGGTLDPRVTFTRASTATYFNSTGMMQTAAANVARFDYNPSTLALNGLLIEEARTNLLINSGSLSSFVPGSATSTVNQAVAPDGTTTMSRLSEVAGTAPHYTRLSLTVTASTIYTFSAFAAAQQNRYLNVVFDDGGSNGTYATFDLVGGVISAPQVATGTGIANGASITAIGGGIYRLTLSGQIATTSARCGLAMSTSGTPGANFPSYAGNTANGLLLWGVQLEVGAFPTSYIPTTSATVTRAADVATIASLTGRNATAESYAAEFTLAGISASANPRIVGNSASQLGPVFVTAARNGATTDLVGTATTANTLTLGAVAKVAANWATPNAGRVCLNAGAVVGATTLTTGFGAMTAPKLMGDSVATDTATGWMRRFRYWPRVLADTELQQVTT